MWVGVCVGVGGCGWGGGGGGEGVVVRGWWSGGIDSRLWLEVRGGEGGER